MPRFDYILESAVGEMIAQGILGQKTLNATATTLNQHVIHRVGVSLYQKFKALAGRIKNLARSPFDITLFVDTDTSFCVNPNLVELLMTFGKTGNADARFVEQDASTGRQATLHVSLAAELSIFQHCIARNETCAKCFHTWSAENNLFCSSCYANCEHFRGLSISKPQRRNCDTFRDTLDLASFKPGMQIGSILVRQGPGLNYFAQQWTELYVKAFALSEETSSAFLRKKKDRLENYANDQQPLHKLVEHFCQEEEANKTERNMIQNDIEKFNLGQIPPNFNFRMFQPDAIGPISGRVIIIHSHHLPELENAGSGLLSNIALACQKVNGDNLGLRLVSGGSFKKSTGEVSLSIQTLIGKNANPLIY